MSTPPEKRAGNCPAKAHIGGPGSQWEFAMATATLTAPDVSARSRACSPRSRRISGTSRPRRAEQRKAKLAKLKAAVEAHADDIVAAVRKDTRKPEGEIRVTEVLNVTGNIQLNIDNLEEWMTPTEITPSHNPTDKALIVYEARGVCLILGPVELPARPDPRPARRGGRGRQLLHRQADRPVPGHRARSPADRPRGVRRERGRAVRRRRRAWPRRCSSCRSTTSSSPAARASARSSWRRRPRTSPA